MTQYKSLTDATATNLVNSLRPWFIGSEEQALVDFGDELSTAILSTSSGETGQLAADMYDFIDNLAGTDTGEGASLVGFLQSGTGAVARTVQDKAGEYVSVLDYMTGGERNAAINRTELVDHSAAIVAAMTDAKATGRRLHFPAGTYIRDVNTLQATFATGESLHISGDGMGATIIKEADGRTLASGRFTKVLYFLAPNGVAAGNLTIENLTIDKNGASNGAEPSSYAWEQAHCCEINASSTGSFRNVVIKNVDTLDKVGGGIVFAAGRVMHAVVENVDGRDFSALFGQRGDLEFQASIDKLIVRDSTGAYMQCEPDAATPTAGISPEATLTDCTYGTLDFAGYSGATSAQIVHLTRVKTTAKIDVRNCKITADRSTLRIGNGTSDYWSRTANGSVLRDCEIINQYDSGADTIESIYIKHEPTGTGTFLDFVRCKFRPDDGASATTTGYAWQQQTVFNPASGVPYLVRFFDCEWSSLYEKIGDLYRAGNVEFYGGKLACRVDAFRIGRDATYTASLVMKDVDTSGVVGKVLRYVGVAGGAAITIKGAHDYASFGYAQDVAITGIDDNTVFMGVFTATAKPTGGGVQGQRVRLTAPAFGSPSEYICTASHVTAATWAMIAQAGIKKDTTANRPTPSAQDVGLQYLDTTLDADGKPIMWNGAAWVDATGATV